MAPPHTVKKGSSRPYTKPQGPVAPNKPEGIMASRWAPQQASSIAVPNDAGHGKGLGNSRWAPQQLCSGAGQNAGDQGKSLVDSRWAPKGATLELKPKKVSYTIFPIFLSCYLPVCTRTRITLTRPGTCCLFCCCHPSHPLQ